jgi:hypothetical protein
LPIKAIPTEDFVNLAHHRWDIENQCFNELANKWHADHFYKYDFNAIQVIWLLIMVAYNIFHVFLARNIKTDMSASQLADEIKAQFFSFDLNLIEIQTLRIVV